MKMRNLIGTGLVAAALMLVVAPLGQPALANDDANVRKVNDELAQVAEDQGQVHQSTLGVARTPKCT